MIFFLYGSDIWRKKKKLEKIKQRFIKEVDFSRLNVIIVDHTDIKEGELMSVVMASPFMVRKRMVILKNILTKGKKKALVEELCEVVEKIKEHTVLVISEDEEKPKKWQNQTIKKVWEDLEKKHEVEVFNLLSEAKLEKEIIKQAKENNLKIKREAVTMLAIFSGGDLEYVEQEVKKLSAFCNPREAEEEDIKKLCIPESEANIFKFLDALGNKNKKSLIINVYKQLKDNDAAALMNRIVSHLRALIAIKTEGEEGARALKLQLWQAKKISAQVRNWDTPALKRILFQVMALDYGIKRGLVGSPATQIVALLARIK